MSISGLLFATLAVASYFTMEWVGLEDREFFLSNVLVPGMLTATCLTGLLFATHMVCLLLRKTLWVEHPRESWR